MEKKKPPECKGYCPICSKERGEPEAPTLGEVIASICLICGWFAALSLCLIFGKY